ncbi:MAG: AAA family ATPase [Coriobacteriia bacterium]|nr:AAA family ATPase [Coriobacteriia bacterium]MCL2536766.1 AAA family ATPase [Coriobacteriia bacterium]
MLITEQSPSAILVLDEIQSVSQWATILKILWDQDARTGVDLRVVVTGSSALLLQSGLSESLMGRFEIIPSTHHKPILQTLQNMADSQKVPSELICWGAERSMALTCTGGAMET